uniref:Uncharacterized protein n=1 Tax=Anguilla anguilla TaxID=7936 RepID=A0A0E9PUN8_ANGAN
MSSARHHKGKQQLYFRMGLLFSTSSQPPALTLNTLGKAPTCGCFHHGNEISQKTNKC